MKIKQVEERLDVPRTHIRYLQREGMFTPRVYANKYRDFTEDDIQDLEMTLILMKAGVSAKDVISLQEEETTLEDVLSRTEAIMKEKVEEMLGGLELIQEIRASNHTFDSLPRDAYWQEIKRKEETGQRFMGHYELEDISDYAELSITMERIVECPHCGGKNRVDLEEFIYDNSSYERQMGVGVQHSFDSTNALECSSCGKAYRISGIVCEYPAGTLETEEIKIDKEWEDCVTCGHRFSVETRELKNQINCSACKRREEKAFSGEYAAKAAELLTDDYVVTKYPENCSDRVQILHITCGITATMNPYGLLNGQRCRLCACRNEVTWILEIMKEYCELDGISFSYSKETRGSINVHFPDGRIEAYTARRLLQELTRRESVYFNRKKRLETVPLRIEAQVYLRLRDVILANGHVDIKEMRIEGISRVTRYSVAARLTRKGYLKRISGAIYTLPEDGSTEI